jgi:hypothetical protein
MQDTVLLPLTSKRSGRRWSWESCRSDHYRSDPGACQCSTAVTSMSKLPVHVTTILGSNLPYSCHCACTEAVPVHHDDIVLSPLTSTQSGRGWCWESCRSDHYPGRSDPGACNTAVTSMSELPAHVTTILGSNLPYSCHCACTEAVPVHHDDTVLSPLTSTQSGRGWCWESCRSGGFRSETGNCSIMHTQLMTPIRKGHKYTACLFARRTEVVLPILGV